MAAKILPKLRGGEDKLGSILPVFLAFAITGDNDIARLHATATELVAEILDARMLPSILQKLGRDEATYPPTNSSACCDNSSTQDSLRSSNPLYLLAILWFSNLLVGFQISF